MKKRDIRRGTLLTMAFAAVAYIGLTVTLWIRQPGGPAEESATFARGNNAGPAWSDTLTNSMSDIPALHRMQTDIEAFMGRWNIKGMSVAVMRHDSLLYSRGIGMADMEAGVEMTPTSIMRIASASKLVTGVAVMRLVEEGKLRLDARVFGPDGILDDRSFTDAMADPRMEDITVDHLLLHAGGFTLGAGDPMFNTKDIMAAKHLTTPPDSLELTRIVLGRRLGFTPGVGRKYSNFGYMLLSLIIERVTGESYWDYVTRNILNPAGVYGMRPATNYYSQRYSNEARYYGPDDEKIEEWNGSGRMVDRFYGGSNVHGLMGAGGWCASAADLARLVSAIDGDSRIPDVIGPSSVSAMTAHETDDKGDRINMARGWGTIDDNGKWTRTGTLSSTHTLIERFPDGECWVLITNSGVWTGHHFSREMSRLVDRLRERYSSLMPRRSLW